jgi:hypothetical protein
MVADLSLSKKETIPFLSKNVYNSLYLHQLFEESSMVMLK